MATRARVVAEHRRVEGIGYHYVTLISNYIHMREDALGVVDWWRRRAYSQPQIGFKVDSDG